MPTGAGVDWSKTPPDIELYQPSIRIRAFRNYWLAWSVAAVAIAVAVYLGCFRGDWRPTGDGRTVVHSRTGEIRTVPETRRP
jgi:hypothetical protein